MLSHGATPSPNTASLPGQSLNSSASLIKNILSQPTTPQRPGIRPIVQQSTTSRNAASAVAAAYTNSLVTDDASSFADPSPIFSVVAPLPLQSSSIHDALSMTAASVSHFSEEERRRLLATMMDMESVKNREVDHLKVRVQMLTKRNAELEATVAMLQRTLEEEASTTMGSFRRESTATKRGIWDRWRRRLAEHRFDQEREAATALVRDVEQAIRMLPSFPAAPARQALLDLAQAEQEWANDRMVYAQRAVAAFRQGPSLSAGSSPLNENAILEAMRVLMHRVDALGKSRFRVLCSTFPAAEQSEGIIATLRQGIDRFLRSVSREQRQLGALPLESTGPTTSRMSSSQLLQHSALLDTSQDVLNTVIAVAAVPCALEQLLSAVCPQEGDSNESRSAQGVVCKLLAGLDNMLLQLPVSQQVATLLHDLLRMHTTRGNPTDLTGEEPLRLRLQRIPGDYQSTYWNQYLASISHATDWVDKNASMSSSSSNYAPPQQRPFRWDLVQTALKNVNDSLLIDDGPHEAAEGDSSTARLLRARKDVVRATRATLL